MKAAEAELKKLQETYNADIQASMTELRTSLLSIKMKAAAKSKKRTIRELLNFKVLEKNIGGGSTSSTTRIFKETSWISSLLFQKRQKTAIEKVAGSNKVLTT